MLCDFGQVIGHLWAYLFIYLKERISIYVWRFSEQTYVKCLEQCKLYISSCCYYGYFIIGEASGVCVLFQGCFKFIQFREWTPTVGASVDFL